MTQIPSKFLLIHVKLLNIRRTAVRLVVHRQERRFQQLTIARTFEYSDNEYLVIELDQPVSDGSTVVVDIEFEGSLTNGIAGMYLGRYTDSRSNATKSVFPDIPTDCH